MPIRRCGVFFRPQMRNSMQPFGKTFLIHSVIAAVLAICVCSTAWAQPKLLDSLRNVGRTIEADPNKEYKLSEVEGPYLILATALSGPTAKQDAHLLVLELRSKYKWNAYVFEKNFTRDAKQDFGQIQKLNAQTKIKYNNQEATEFAVVVGNFPSLEDNRFKKTLVEVRKCQPESLKGKASTSAFSFPMAFGLVNPLLPPAYQQSTVDAFVASINTDPYTLLKNPRRYTVQIATFTGRAVIKPEDIRAIEEGKIPFEQQASALELGAQAAAALCQTLRKSGVEAYNFHDRHSSIVTVGGFDQPERKLPDGTMIPDPQIQQIIQQYQGKVINGIQCSPQPRLIDVPRAPQK